MIPPRSFLFNGVVTTTISALALAMLPGCGDGLAITAQSTCSADVDLKVYHVGQIVAEAITFSGDETVTFDTIAGETYLLAVEGYNELAVAYLHHQGERPAHHGARAAGQDGQGRSPREGLEAAIGAPDLEPLRRQGP